MVLILVVRPLIVRLLTPTSRKDDDFDDDKIGAAFHLGPTTRLLCLSTASVTPIFKNSRHSCMLVLSLRFLASFMGLPCLLKPM